jgi:hypothetical protein
MLKQGYNMTYLNNTQENWEGGVIGGEELEHKEFKERKRSNRASNSLSSRK